MNNEELQQIYLKLEVLHKTLATIEHELATLQMQLTTIEEIGDDNLKELFIDE